MYWIKATVVIAHVLLGSVAFASEPAAPPSTSAVVLPPKIESLVTESLDGSEYVDTTQCISGLSTRDIVILSNEYLLFVGRDDRLWLNRLKRRCFGLRHNMQLAPTAESFRFCQSDRLRARRADGLERGVGFESFGRKPPEEFAGTRCILGVFESIDPQQAIALRAQLQTNQ